MKPSILPFYKAGIDSHSIEQSLIAHTSLNTIVFIHQSNNKGTIIDIFRFSAVVECSGDWIRDKISLYQDNKTVRINYLL